MDENKKDYEIAFLLTSAEAANSLADILSQQEAEITHKSPVAEVNLAYPIKKHKSAQFGFYQFRANSEVIKNIQDVLALNQNVLRFMIITPPVKMVAQTKPERKQPAPIVSNEALSEKLEEILK
jgi:ribosomal protein S6